MIHHITAKDTVDEKVIQALENKDTSQTAITQERVSGGANSKSPMENVMVKVIDLEYEINDDIDKLLDLKKEIIETINKLSDLNYQLLLEIRYINGRYWDDVATSMGYDRRWILRLHGRALKEIEKIINKPLKATPKLCYNIKCKSIEKLRVPYAVVYADVISIRFLGNAAFLITKPLEVKLWRVFSMHKNKGW